MKSWYTLRQMSSLAKKLHSQKKKLILITGCFDFIHFGHINFLRYAKKLGDVLILGLDNDENIKINKGITRPLFTFPLRVNVLSELKSIDYIFKIDSKILFSSENADRMLRNVLQKIRPDILVTNPFSDKTWRRKKMICQKLKIPLLVFNKKRIYSSTKLIEEIINLKKPQNEYH